MLVGVALSALLVAAGCGGGDDSATGSSGDVTVETGSLSKAEFVKQASAICKKTQENFTGEAAAFVTKTNKEPPKPTETGPEEKLVETILIPNFESQVEEISELGAPSGDEEEVTAFLDSLQAVLDEASEDPQAFIETEGSFGRAPKLAQKYGLTGCAEI